MDLSDLTVVVPARNEEANVPAFLHSLPPEVQLLIVDSSTDETPALITRLRPHHTRVIRRTVNITHARQIGAEAAQTPWLVFTDMDITFAPGYFAALPGYASGQAIYGPKLATQGNYVQYYRWFSSGQQLAHLLGIPAVSGSNLVVRKDALQQSGGFDLTLPCNEDSELGWRLKRSGFAIDFCPQLIVFAHDDRRLQRGVLNKLIHSLSRCALLYSGLLPARLRQHDWGYWAGAVDQ